MRTAPLVVALLCVLASAFVVLFGRDERQKEAAAVLAASLIAAIAVVANDAWLYGGAVFLIAAPIAGPAFAQNIAAIFLDRQWALKDLGSPINPAEAGPSAEESPGTSPVPPSPHNADFHTAAVSALAADSALQGAQVRQNLTVSRSGHDLGIDAVALRDDGSATVYQLKNSTKPAVLQNAADALRTQLEAYRSASGIANVSATLVVPKDAYSFHPATPGIRVASLNPETGELEYDD